MVAVSFEMEQNYKAELCIPFSDKTRWIISFDIGKSNRTMTASWWGLQIL